MSRKMKTLIGMTLATMLILLMKIANSVTWIRNHILQMHDEYDIDDDPNFSDMGDCDD